MGGRSLRATAEFVYGTSCMGGEGIGREAKKLGERIGKRGKATWDHVLKDCGGMFDDIGGVKVWRECLSVKMVGRS